MAVTLSVGVLAWRFACVSFSGGPCCVPSYIYSFWHLRRLARTLAPLPYLALVPLASVGIPLALLVPLGLWGVRFMALVRSSLACGSLHLVYLWLSLIPYFFPCGRPRKCLWVVGQRRGPRGG